MTKARLPRIAAGAVAIGALIYAAGLNATPHMLGLLAGAGAAVAVLLAVA